MPRGKKPKKEPELSLDEELTSEKKKQEEEVEEKPEETSKEEKEPTANKDEEGVPVQVAGLKKMPKLLLFSDGTLENTTIIVDGKKISFSDFLLESDSTGGVLKLKYQRNVEITL